MNSEGEEPRDNKSSTGTAARKRRLEHDQEDVPPLQGEELEELRASLVQLKPESVDTAPLAAAEAARDQDVVPSGEAGVPGASEAMAAPTSEGSVEPPRASILTILTATPGPVQTSHVTHMDVSQGHSTAAPFPELESGEDFPAARSDVITIGVHTDQLDLSSLCFSFTTADPAVLRTRILLVSEPVEVLSQLDVLEHGKRLLARIQMRQDAPVVTKSAVQEYLDRLGKTDFGTYAVSAKEDLAQTFTTLIEDSGLRFLCRDLRDGRDKKIARTEVFVPNDRSHGSFQFSVGGRPITSASWPVMRAVFPNEARQILDRRKSD